MEPLKKLRTKLGVSQTVVAKALDISQQAYANYETGNRQPDNSMLKKIADYFSVSVDFMLERDEDPQKNMHLSKTDRRILELIQDTPELGEVILDIVTALESYSQEEADALLAFLKARKKP